MASKRGRSPGFIMGEEHRNKIGKSNILRRLIKFAEGDPETKMTPAEVTAAAKLLDKVMPNLQSLELSGDPDAPIETVNRIELVAPSENSAN